MHQDDMKATQKHREANVKAKAKAKAAATTDKSKGKKTVKKDRNKDLPKVQTTLHKCMSLSSRLGCKEEKNMVNVHVSDHEDPAWICDKLLSPHPCPAPEEDKRSPP
jgi:hypothetical protein